MGIENSVDPHDPDSHQPIAAPQAPISVDDVLNRSFEGLRSRELLFLITALREVSRFDRTHELSKDPRCEGLVARAVLSAPHLSEKECVLLASSLHDLNFRADERPLDAVFHLLHHHAPYLELRDAVTLGKVVREQKRTMATPAVVALETQLQILVSTFDPDRIGGTSQRMQKLILSLFGHILPPESLAVLKASKALSDGEEKTADSDATH